jgi:hypothetical protein
MSNEKESFQVEAITKQLAHIVKDENLFVDRIRKIDENIYESEFIIAGDHPYLYENSAISNHVSGTSFLDVTRQLCKAMSHIYYDVPINCRFVMQNTQMDFFGWTKCSIPIYILLDVSVEKRLLGGFMSPTFEVKLSYSQEGYELGTIYVKFSAFSHEIEEKLMSRQYRRKPIDEKIRTVSKK